MTGTPHEKTDLKMIVETVVFCNGQEISDPVVDVLMSWDDSLRTLNVTPVDDRQTLLKTMSERPDIALVVLCDEYDDDLVTSIRRTDGMAPVRIIAVLPSEDRTPKPETIRLHDLSAVLTYETFSSAIVHPLLHASLSTREWMLRNHRTDVGVRTLSSLSDDLFEQRSLEGFLESIMRNFSHTAIAETPSVTSVFIADTEGYGVRITAGSGRFRQAVGEDITLHPEFDEVFNRRNPDIWTGLMAVLPTGFLARHVKGDATYGYVFVACDPSKYLKDMVRLVLVGYVLAYDNLRLETVARQTQDEILYFLSEAIETQFNETAGHVRRVSTMMHRFALVSGFTPDQAETLRIASSMHDVGKIGIPERILKKPGKLTDREMDVMRTHAQIGHDLLKTSELEVFSVAGTIALYHHEWFDGTGYPFGIAGYDIPKVARLMAVIDVYDALTHDRVYRGAIAPEDALAHIRGESGRHFDPELVDLFVRHFKTITKE
jgi:hypothetical protein